MADRRDIQSVEVQICRKPIHPAAATATSQWRVLIFVVVVARSRMQRGAEIVLEIHDQPIAWMDAQVRRRATVRFAIAVVHLPARVAEVFVSQFYFQYAVFTAQVCGLWDEASNRGTRTSILRDTL